MNAKEWLIQEFEINEYSAEHHAFLTLFETSIPLMERYANNKTKELQAQILNFRQKLNVYSKLENNEAEFAEWLLGQFDKHFNLTTERYGTI